MNKLIQLNCALEVKKEFKLICEPIFVLLNLNFFRFMRVYDDLSRVVLATNYQWTEQFYSLGVQSFAGNDTLFCKSDHSYSENKTICQEKLAGPYTQELCNNMQGCTVVQKQPYYTDFYDFSNYPNKPAIDQIYLKYPEVFHHFIFYFREKSYKIVSDLQKHMLRNKAGTKIKNKEQMPESYFSEIQKNTFLKTTKVDKYYISHTKTKEIFLTALEISCVEKAARGLTAEQVAKQLKLNVKKVDDYIESVKAKLTCNELSEIMQKLAETGILEDCRLSSKSFKAQL